MKTEPSSLTLGLLLVGVLACSCAGDPLEEEGEGEIDYGNLEAGKASLTLNGSLLSADFPIYDAEAKETVSNLVAGDKLKVYLPHSDPNKRYGKCGKASMLPFIKFREPGAPWNSYAFHYPDSRAGLYLHAYDLNYAITTDGSLLNFVDIEDGTYVYVSYDESESELTTVNTRIINAKAVYLYPIR